MLIDVRRLITIKV